MERWRPIDGYEKLYLVSDEGRVYSIRKRRNLKQKIDKYGYPCVALSQNGTMKHRTVHRLVAEVFVPNCLNKPCVNHINEIKTDNRATNLEWVTVKENDNHGTRNARMANTKKRQPIKQLDLNLIEVCVHAGIKDAQKSTGINRNSIREVCQGKRKTAGGYIWRYANNEQL